MDPVPAKTKIVLGLLSCLIQSESGVVDLSH